MYDVELAAIEDHRVRLERELAARDPAARTTAAEYLELLTGFIQAFNNGPGSDSRLMGADTTGSLERVEERVVWAEAERHRVRRELNTIA